MSAAPFTGYTVVHVKRPGRKEPVYVCQAMGDGDGTFFGFACGACGKETVQEGYRWRCKCGARVYTAIPTWYAERLGVDTDSNKEKT